MLHILPILCLVIGVELKDWGNSRILNGYNSSVLPYQVSIDAKRWGCGGALIRPDWVLTAKHCVPDNPIKVIAGISNLQETGETREVPVNSMIKHDTADLALLKIDPPFEESDKIKPIPINDIHENLDGKEVLISGWGKTTAITYPDQLQALHIKITNHTLRPGMISMLSSEGEGSCFGDSGGPAVLEGKNNVLVGISSSVNAFDSNMNEMDHITRKNVCGKDANNGKQWPYQLSNYVDVFKYANWIKNQTNKINGIF